MTKITRKEKEIILWELGQGKRGDGSAYDKKLDKIIMKIKELI